MVCLGLEARAAGWWVQTNPLSYGGTPSICNLMVLNEFAPKQSKIHSKRANM